MRIALACVLSGIFVTVPSSVAHASVASIMADVTGSTDHIGTFTGTVTYTGSGTMGTLIIALTNTDPISGSGFITGVVFDTPSTDSSVSAMLTSTDHAGFQFLSDPSAPPFGTYQFGAAIGGNWLGGGSPNGGIAAGANGSFTFKITASDAGTLTAAGFVSSTSPSGMLIRFKGFQPDNSDKVPVMLLPGPTAATLLGLGGVAASRRRRDR